jgi:hypothetical protein
MALMAGRLYLSIISALVLLRNKDTKSTGITVHTDRLYPHFPDRGTALLVAARPSPSLLLLSACRFPDAERNASRLLVRRGNALSGTLLRAAPISTGSPFDNNCFP